MRVMCALPKTLKQNEADGRANECPDDAAQVGTGAVERRLPGRNKEGVRADVHVLRSETERHLQGGRRILIASIIPYCS